MGDKRFLASAVKSLGTLEDPPVFAQSGISPQVHNQRLTSGVEAKLVLSLGRTATLTGVVCRANCAPRGVVHQLGNAAGDTKGINVVDLDTSNKFRAAGLPTRSIDEVGSAFDLMVVDGRVRASKQRMK